MIEQKLGANHLNERDPEEVFEIVELLGTGFFLKKMALNFIENLFISKNRVLWRCLLRKKY